MSKWRDNFPALNNAYLDSAATAHKPRAVIDRVSDLLGYDYATVSRGVYKSSQDMTATYEAARLRVARFARARNAHEIVFTKNATESLNLVAQTWGRDHLTLGDRVLLTEMEHHANIVPWQLMQQDQRFAIDVLPITDSGDLDLEGLERLITSSTKLFSFTAVSNLLGTINPVREIVRMARTLNPDIVVCVDASQAAPHGFLDVAEWDCDFAVFTGHKVYGPTGIGVLYGREAILNGMRPFLGGGDMIEDVSFDRSIYRSAPHRFEAGTPPFVEAIGLATAIDYLDDIGWDAIVAYEEEMKTILFDTLRACDGVRVIGSPKNRIGIAPFLIDGCHPQDIAMIFDQMGVCVRVGHHCAMPLLRRLGHSALVRASIALYTNEADIAMLGAALSKAQRMLAA